MGLQLPILCKIKNKHLGVKVIFLPKIPRSNIALQILHSEREIGREREREERNGGGGGNRERDIYRERGVKMEGENIIFLTFHPVPVMKILIVCQISIKLFIHWIHVKFEIHRNASTPPLLPVNYEWFPPLTPLLRGLIPTLLVLSMSFDILWKCFLLN